MQRLIICPSKAKPALLTQFRKYNPLCDIKIVSKEEVINAKYGRFINEDGVLKFLIKEHGYSYGYASQVLKYLPRVNESNAKTSRLERLLTIKNECIKQFSFKVDQSFIDLIRGKDAEIYYYENDKYLDKSLDELNISYKYIEFNHRNFPSINAFKYQNDELLFVFSKIGNLLNSGVSIDKIKLFNIGNFKKIDIKRVSNNFGININYHNNQTYLSQPATVQFINLYEEGKNLDEICEILIESNSYDEIFIQELYKIASDYNFFDSDREKQLSLFKEVFKQYSIRDPLFVEAVNVTNSLIINDDEYLFILDFSEKTCPPILSSDDFITDKEKALLDIPNDEYKNAINKQEFIHFLQQNPNIFISWSSKIDNSENLVSPLKDELKMDLTSEIDNKVFYGKDEFVRSFGALEDYEDKYSVTPLDLPAYENVSKLDDSSYKTYSNSFTNFSITHDNLLLSFSSLDLYSNCPFKYYLSKILDINDYADTVYTDTGKFIHKILENIDANIDYDTLFLSTISAEKYEQIEEIFLPRYKREFEIIYKRVHEFHENIVANHQFFHEENITIELNSNKVKGFVDSIITFGEDNENIVFIDYKFKSTASRIDEDEFREGLNLQLPTYAFLSKNDPRFKDKNVAGVYFLNLKSDKNYLLKYDDVYKNIKLDGVSIRDFDLMNTFVPGSHPDKKIRGFTPILSHGQNSKEHPEQSYKKAKTKEWFDDVINIANNVYLKTFKEIENNSFAISPVFLNFDELSCQYCNYKDICFVKKENFRNIDTITPKLKRKESSNE